MSLLNVEHDEGLLVVRFAEKRLGSEHTAQFGSELEVVASQARGRGVLLHLHGVLQLSSSIVGQLFVFKNRCGANRVSLKLCGMSPDIQQLFALVQLDKFLDVYDSEEAARAAFDQEFDEATTEDDETINQFREAAARGEAAAQYELGRMFDDGRVAPDDSNDAYMWYEKAAQQGNADAQYMLGMSHAYGIHVAVDYGQALHWYGQAADRGHTDACYLLGMTHHYGIGVEEDRAEAARWYQRAADQGHEAAQSALAEFAGD